MDNLILLVEDEDVLRENIKEILELYDYNVVEFSNGYDALNFMDKKDVNLIISDLMMPNMDGHEFLSRVRSNPNLSEIPFILLSAKVEKKDRDKSLKMGANLYLTKPIKSKDLIKSIKSIV
jgi:CheY-like chemotaxis protein